MRARLTAILVVLIGILGAAVVLSGPVAAAPAAGPVSVPLSPDDEGPFVKGQLVDESGEGEEPVEGVEIIVLDEGGSEVGTATTDAEGNFAVPVPGSGTYTARLNADTLPEGIALRNPEDIEQNATVVGFDKVVQFPIGPDERQTTGQAEIVIALIVSGFLFSTILALAALGLSMIFGTTGLTNFSHGELVSFGAIITYLINRAGTSVLVAATAALIVAGVFGLLQDTLLWRRLRERGTGLIAMMIVSIGLAIFLRAIYQYVIGGNRLAYTQYVTSAPWQLGPVQIPPRDLVIMAVAIAVLVLTALALQYTRTGKAMRAVADNPPLSASSGINVDRVIAVVWTGGAALAGLGGVLYALKFQLDYQMGLRLLLLIFAAVVLGGLGTIWGAMVGSLVVGLFTELSTLVVPSELKYVGALALLILILLVRPQGILGRAQRVG
ncbi:MAG: branched-chain amino acid ABC transporter permease [Actinomycetota bacterium]|nr:branched-chain amino acid ABC transporter permease [Actinomycetota bacterium]